jgi:hypothetical protein
MEYDPALVPQKNRERLKEWDFYSFTAPGHYFELTMADISWLSFAASSFRDFVTGEVVNNLAIINGADVLSLPHGSYENLLLQNGDLHVSVTLEGGKRILGFHFPKSLTGPQMSGELNVEDDPAWEFLATAAPFKNPGYFFYTNKIVALPVSGRVDAAGKAYTFSSADSFAVLDWGRGVWPQKFEWGWAVAAGMVDGKRVGFNIGFGDEDPSRFTGSAVVVDGVLHKMGVIDWFYPKDDVMKNWSFRSGDGRFDVVLEPFLDQSARMDLGAYATDTTKVQGMVSGRIVLDDGSELRLDGIMGFAEHCLQRW